MLYSMLKTFRLSRRLQSTSSKFQSVFGSGIISHFKKVVKVFIDKSDAHTSDLLGITPCTLQQFNQRL